MSAAKSAFARGRPQALILGFGIVTKAALSCTFARSSATVRVVWASRPRAVNAAGGPVEPAATEDERSGPRFKTREAKGGGVAVDDILRPHENGLRLPRTANEYDSSLMKTVRPEGTPRRARRDQSPDIASCVDGRCIGALCPCLCHTSLKIQHSAMKTTRPATAQRRRG